MICEYSDNIGELRRLAADLHRVHLPRAQKASQARIMIYLLDEVADPGTTTEFDGANPHMVRVGIFDLTTKEHLLRLRRHVDPSWVSDKRRVYFARGFNSCRLAMQVRARALGSTATPGRSSQ